MPGLHLPCLPLGVQGRQFRIVGCRCPPAAPRLGVATGKSPTLLALDQRPTQARAAS
jgi:hypothetical protein